MGCEAFCIVLSKVVRSFNNSGIERFDLIGVQNARNFDFFCTSTFDTDHLGFIALVYLKSCICLYGVASYFILNLSVGMLRPTHEIFKTLAIKKGEESLFARIK